MPKWTKQEQQVFWIVLAIFLSGIGTRLWLEGRDSRWNREAIEATGSSPAR